MAATPFDAAIPTNSFLFDVYNDGQPPAQIEWNIPTGACYFADTSPGANGARCGCRRFYSRQQSGTGALGNNYNPGEALMCMCAHHACFHDLHQPGQVPASAADGVALAGQENERPRINREPLSPVQDFESFRMPSSLGATLDLNLLDLPASISIPHPKAAISAPSVHQDQNYNHGQDSSMPDTLDWGAVSESQAVRTDFLPPIPSQCLMPSQPPSTASSSQTRYLRPFAGKGLQTLSGASAAAQPQDPTLDSIAETVNPEDRPRMAASQAPQGAQDTQTSATARGVTAEAFQHVSKVVEGHEQRLDRLENLSFTAGHDECQAKHEDSDEKHDHTDLRVTELESRVEEVERILKDDNSSLTSGRRLARRGAADDATASVVSVASNTSSAVDRSELYSQLEALKAQISYLQASSAPSYSNPWELEVVFLPFPLKGIWIEARDFPITTLDAPGTNTDDGWTQMPHTASKSALDPRSLRDAALFGDVHGPDWLLPRACAPGRQIDHRLRSRGLVKTVVVRGADARSVQLAVNAAFSDVLRMSNISKTSRALTHRNGDDDEETYRLPAALGPHQSWVPLRKIHKDSRLRFLNPSEMVTPALWDYQFLTSSVVMKASGTHRLYITQREAYLQDHPIGYRALEAGWTWQRLRMLTRVYPDSQSSNGDVPEADALEECWTWNDRLDEPPSSHSSSTNLRPIQDTRRLSRERSTTSLSQQYFTGVQSPILSNSPRPIRANSPLALKDSKGGRPSRVRTKSLPLAAPTVASPQIAKRRISAQGSISSNHPYDRRSSPLMTRPSPRLPYVTTSATGSTSFSRRRQATRSPIFVPRTTPRWSQPDRSRSSSLAPHAAQGYVDNRSDRRTTPFWYATPRSNVPPETVRSNSRGPVIQLTEYYTDEDEDMQEDHGSSTDPYDSEMTNDADAENMMEHPGDVLRHSAAVDDGDIDIGIYEDEPDNLDEIDTDDHTEDDQHHNASTTARYLAERNYAHGQGQGHAVGGPLPEDEPWPGIEDHMSDGENMNPLPSSDEDVVELGNALDRQNDASSDVSSQPSEYPSTQRPWHVTGSTDALSTGRRSSGVEGYGQVHNDMDADIEFHIHEDSDTDDDGLESQWA